MKQDGTVGPPHVSTQFLPGKLYSEWAHLTLHVVVIDVLGTTCEMETLLNIKVLGDRWEDRSYEWFTKAIPLGVNLTLPPELSAPAPPSVLTGLRPPVPTYRPIPRRGTAVSPSR